MAGRIYFKSNVFGMIILLLISLNINLATEATTKNNGFTIDLIHRDSPNSPLYKPHATPFERFNDVIRRTVSRLNSLNMSLSSNINSKNNVVQSNVSTDNGEYVMKFSIGTPPLRDIYGIVDTGSDLMWVQCLPCEQCYKQLNPIYNPAMSSSYKQVPCQSEQCHLLDTNTISCSSEHDISKCNYTYGYGDSSLTKGVLSTETITFANSASFDNIVFGCGHNNTGAFNQNEMGLVGLGGKKLSLASQISSQLGANKFSYCLVPFHTDPSITSKMYFGSGSEVSGDGVVSTSLVSKEDKTYYFLTLEGISIGSNKAIPYYNSSGAISKGNMFIDSGVPPTLLPKDFYNHLEQEVRNAIKLTPYQDPQLGSQLCYKTKSMVGIAPTLTAHFEGGAKLPLIHTSTFISPPVEGVFCFAMQPIEGDVGIFGNFAQSNVFIGYDLDSHIVSFKPTDCTKQ